MRRDRESSRVGAEDQFLKPVLQALILADRVYEDKLTGKRVIAGTFSTLRFRKAPVSETTQEGQMMRMAIPPGGMHAGSPYAYVSMTDVHNQAKLLLRYVNLETQDMVFQTEIVVNCDDRLATVELAIPLPSLPVIAGVYALEVISEEELLGSHRVIVKEQTD